MVFYACRRGTRQSCPNFRTLRVQYPAAARGYGRRANGARSPSPQPSTALCRPIPKRICSRHIRGQAAPADHRRPARRSANEKHEQQEMHMTSNHESNDRALKRCPQQLWDLIPAFLSWHGRVDREKRSMPMAPPYRHLVPIEENAALACLAD